MESDFTVHHVIASDQVSRDAMQGLKYVQSDIEGIFFKIKEMQNSEKKVMFVGTL